MKRTFNEDDIIAHTLKQNSAEKRSDVEKMLESSPEAQVFADDLEALSTLLTEGYSDEPVIFLTPEQRAAILSEEETQAGFGEQLFPGLFRGMGLAACAALMLFAGLNWLNMGDHDLGGQQLAFYEPAIIEHLEASDEESRQSLYQNMTFTEVQPLSDAFSEQAYRYGAETELAPSSEEVMPSEDYYYYYYEEESWRDDYEFYEG